MSNNANPPTDLVTSYEGTLPGIVEQSRVYEWPYDGIATEGPEMIFVVTTIAFFPIAST